MTVTTLDIAPAAAPFSVSITRPDGDPLDRNGNIAAGGFGIAAGGVAYFDVAGAAVGETAELGYDGSVGRFFLYSGAGRGGEQVHLMLALHAPRSRRSPDAPVVLEPNGSGWTVGHAAPEAAASRPVLPAQEQFADAQHARSVAQQPLTLQGDQAAQSDRQRARVPATLATDGAAQEARALARVAYHRPAPLSHVGFPAAPPPAAATPPDAARASLAEAQNARAQVRAPQTLAPGRRAGHRAADPPPAMRPVQDAQTEQAAARAQRADRPPVTLQGGSSAQQDRASARRPVTLNGERQPLSSPPTGLVPLDLDSQRARAHAREPQTLAPGELSGHAPAQAPAARPVDETAAMRAQASRSQAREPDTSTPSLGAQQARQHARDHVASVDQTDPLAGGDARNRARNT